ncbi:hypothetical protein [Vibrio aquimaris]|uniref:Uncharacterized protein n=1 Tax=Vibrio aquimaris TaxID=2587862 RepID=A0A5P9CJD6_9VIBR|nr:hypothetical protein [Vibrio aquimaris]QFT26326.1 hypothetical protein FIV01_07790 [Vibrio aquimaris]
MKRLYIALPLLFPLTTLANEFEAALKQFAMNDVKSMAADADVVSQIKAQNQQTSQLDQSQITSLDNDWRSQVGQDNAPLINSKLNSELSKKLAAMQQKSQGVITEIFVMDNKGLNVAQSAVTSDYWQGDEDKWQQTYLVGPNAYHISEIEEDESTQMFQSQVSYAISDPASGQVIGAITVGVNVEEL